MMDCSVYQEDGRRFTFGIRVRYHFAEEEKCALANLPFCANGPALTLLALPCQRIRAMREGRIVVSVFPQLKRICGVASSVAVWRHGVCS